MRCLFFAVCLSVVLVVVSRAAAAATQPAATQPAVTDAQRAAVMAELKKVRPGNVDIDGAENGLARLGKEYLPAMREALASPEKLVSDEEVPARPTPAGKGTIIDQEPHDQQVKTYRTYRVIVLKAGIIRVEWGFSPKKVIFDWMEANRPRGVEAPHVRYTPQYVDDEAVAAMLPGYLVYSSVIPQFPVAREPTPPLGVHNLFFLDKKGAVSHVTDVLGLERFFKEHLAAVKDEAGARRALHAWLRLSTVLASDGFLQFTIDDTTFTFGGAQDDPTPLIIRGKAEVQKKGGDGGEIMAKMKFDAEGKLSGAIRHEVEIKEGVRPICQATKLLDADPVVRKMAERDLLVMGRSAREYMEEQREKAGPELRAAIDEVWRRIVERER